MATSMDIIGRQIRQVAISESAEGDGYSRTIVALCTDGTLWEFTTGERAQWIRLPPIPEK